jgi:hypothetical protein
MASHGWFLGMTLGKLFFFPKNLPERPRLALFLFQEKKEPNSTFLRPRHDAHQSPPDAHKKTASA